ncbi:retroviral-like aspartic protease family protein [Aestuariirhabdus sp. Z084]|uniref:retropepsin-like aspartic protease family protein n=1 Tax=Aestuariirhabdus haliotis TaxID=2918751 RepID=UPI00201B362D|nr:retropepsin-like aspartic protease [Aestuariirhabdus haliotis]MCL6415984.1 retroviral-like aspartic protease family protein [Aestuariirhabdus haliotis]MCL6419983.1 retroviral-like aspartic protease family protein [Aestuariirhabdus haliotis]
MTQNNPHKRSGRWMMAVAWIIGLVLLTRYFAGVEEQLYNPNATPATQTDIQGNPELVLKQNRYGHYVLGGTINGHNATLLLDTGATAVVVASDLAKEIGLKRGLPSYAQTANGRVQVYNTRIDQLKLGNILLHDVSATINPAMHGNEVLLGMSALRQLEFTQRGEELTLRLLPAG